jgi:hypothetical protein
MHPLCHTLPAGDARARADTVKTWGVTLCAISCEASIARGKIAACCGSETDRASHPARNVQPAMRSPPPKSLRSPPPKSQRCKK